VTDPIDRPPPRDAPSAPGVPADAAPPPQDAPSAPGVPADAAPPPGASDAVTSSAGGEARTSTGSDAALAVAPEEALPETRAGIRDPTSRSLALLLAAAAVVAAIVGTRANMLSGSASSAWQEALRSEIKRSAATTEDIRFVYASEARIAFQLITAQVREQELRAEAERRSGAERESLLFEAEVQAAVVDGLRQAVPMAADDTYLLPDGGYDLVRRLADTRAEHPELVALDPEAPQVRGDRSAARSVLMAATSIPIGVTFLLGALAQPFKSRRRILRAAAAASLSTAIVLAVAVELFA
jgi:hypothetical protein